MKLFLAPHNDDETLFGTYTLLKYQPMVLVCLRSFVQVSWDRGPSWYQREDETDCAMRQLGCEWHQGVEPDTEPNWAAVLGWIKDFDTSPEVVFAPAPEVGGHHHHNTLGEMAMEVWPGETVFYLTYTRDKGKSEWGQLVVPESGWDLQKARALECYASQIKLPQTGMHFTRSLAEYQHDPR